MGSCRGSPSISTKPIVTRASGTACGGCFCCGGTCASDPVAKPAAKSALRTPRAQRRSCRAELLIDHNTPGNTAGRNGDRRLAAAHVHDGHVVAEAVRDIERALVAG